jgi:glycerol transport system permease protein
MKWYREVLHSEKFWNALWRNLVFSGVILAIQIPLGVLIALNMPRKGWGVPVCLVLMALPLLIPWYVVGMIWQMFGRVDIGLMGVMLRDFGYNYEGDPMDAWFTLILMDVWHWTSLVALLAYAGLVSIPDAYYQAARIDGASKWAVFRYIQLPKLGRVLTIAILLRFMDSFMIFTEPFRVAGGDPVFLSIELEAEEEELGWAAMSIIFFLIILAISWVFYAVMTREDASRLRPRPERRVMSRAAFLDRAGDLHPVPADADLLARQHELQDQRRDHRALHAVPGGVDARQLRQGVRRPQMAGRVLQLDLLCAAEHADLDRRGAAGGLRLLALQVLRRQAPVLLAADQPHGAGGGVRAAVLPALLQGSACSTRTSPWRWRIACSTCRWRCGFSKAS